MYSEFFSNFEKFIRYTIAVITYLPNLASDDGDDTTIEKIIFINLIILSSNTLVILLL